jgi:hypothetical protein
MKIRIKLVIKNYYLNCKYINSKKSENNNNYKNLLY